MHANDINPTPILENNDLQILRNVENLTTDSGSILPFFH